LKTERALRMNRITTSLIQLPESPRALPVLLGFAALLMGALFIVRLNADLNYDGEIYIAAAMKFAEGMFREGLAIYPMPVYPLLIALTHTVLPDWVLAGRLISLISMILLVIPMHLLTKDLFSARAAFWSCIVFILLPESLAHSNSVLRDPSFYVLFISAVYFAQRAMHSGQFKHLLLCALFGSLSTFFRVEGLILFPVFFCFLIGAAVFNAKESKRYIRIASSGAVLGALLTACSYIAVMSADAEGLNRYIDWIIYYRGFNDLSFFGELPPHRRSTAADKRIISIYGDRAACRRNRQSFFAASLCSQHASNAFGDCFGIQFDPFDMGLSSSRLQLKTTPRSRPNGRAPGARVRFFYSNGDRPETLHSDAQHPALPVDRIRHRQGPKFCSTDSPYLRLGTACIVLMVFLYPVTEFDKFFKNRDDLASRAGSWIAQNQELRDFRIVYNDQIVKFHADLESKNQRRKLIAAS
jgi:hypothetical protein